MCICLSDCSIASSFVAILAVVLLVGVVTVASCKSVRDLLLELSSHLSSGRYSSVVQLILWLWTSLTVSSTHVGETGIEINIQNWLLLTVDMRLPSWGSIFTASSGVSPQ
jgi:hypothetical protein